MDFSNWVSENTLNIDIHPDYPSLFYIDGVGVFLLLDDSEKERIFDLDFNLILNQVEQNLSEEANFYCFKFGPNFYYTEIGKPVQLNLFKYLGKSSQANEQDFPYLGIHSRYEIMNGMGDYETWIKGAKFYNTDCVGIVEYNTLGGSLAFQDAADKFKINKVVGATYKVHVENEVYVYLKCYVINQIGWVNLLNINAASLVFNDNFVPLSVILARSEGIIIVIDQHSFPDENLLTTLSEIFKDRIYFQFDPSEYKFQTKEENHLKNLSFRFNHIIPSVLIQDMYYLDRKDADIKKMMNDIAQLSVYQSIDQFFKPLSEIKSQYSFIFQESNKDNAELFWQEIIDNAIHIANSCKNFKIPVNQLYLPDFELTEEQKIEFGDTTNYFYHLLQEGFNDKLVNSKTYKIKNIEVYEKRLDYELSVIEKGGMIQYFLILNDAATYCIDNDIQAGFGRGSGSGSLVNYLLNITNVDPIRYDLMFERFLNPARLGLEETRATYIDHESVKDNVEVIEIESSDGVLYSFTLDSIVEVEREGKRMSIPIFDVVESDEILIAI